MLRAISVLAAAAVLLLSGCASDPLAKTVNASDTGYVAGDGATTSFAQADRGAAIEFSGADGHGEQISEQQFRGSVTVVNFWYAGCAPCRAEIADLTGAAAAFEGQQVKFLGVNTRDQPAQAEQFNREFSVRYPSIIDAVNGRQTQAAFAGAVPLNATPTTLVLDRQGRVAHRVVGQLASQSQLETLIKETLQEV